MQFCLSSRTQGTFQSSKDSSSKHVSAAMTLGGGARDYCVTMVASLGVCLSMWWMLRKREKEDTLPPLVSLTRRQVAQYWLDGMFWKAILLAGQEAQEKWGSSIFRMRGTGLFDAPSVHCIDSTYVDALLGANGLEKSHESYEALVDAFGQGTMPLIVRKMHENYNDIRKPIMNFFSLSNIGKRLDCCRGKLEDCKSPHHNMLDASTASIIYRHL